MALVAFLSLFFLLQMVPPIEGAFLLQAGSWGVDTFVDVFGISPRMCCIVWVRCRLRQEIPGVGVKHFLWALAFLRVYATQTCLRSMMGHPSRQVFRTWMWKVVKAIANAFEEVVSEFYYCCFPLFYVYSHFLFASSLLQVVFENRFRNDRRRTCKITVDCTDCAISEPWPWESGFNRQFFSHKINGAALKYEVGVCIQTGDIVWVNGPFKAGKWNDIKLYRRTLKEQLLPGEMVEADRGYRGDETVRCPDTVFSRSDKQAKQKARARHETVNGRLKNFRVLASVFRHERNLHQFVFYAVAVLIQISFENGSPPFSVRY
jgi:hypothetical protein